MTSAPSAAAQFGLAVSTVINWVRRFLDTGGVTPLKMGGHKPKDIIGEHNVFLAQRIRKRNGAGRLTLVPNLLVGAGRD